MMNNDLKPCPFCGGEAIAQLVFPPFMLKKFHRRFAAAGCKECGASTILFAVGNKTRSPLLNEAHEQDAKKKAVEAWNRRAGNV